MNRLLVVSLSVVLLMCASQALPQHSDPRSLRPRAVRVENGPPCDCKFYAAENYDEASCSAPCETMVSVDAATNTTGKTCCMMTDVSKGGMEKKMDEADVNVDTRVLKLGALESHPNARRLLRSTRIPRDDASRSTSVSEKAYVCCYYYSCCVCYWWGCVCGLCRYCWYC